MQNCRLPVNANGVIITLSPAMLVISITSIWSLMARLRTWLTGIRDLAYHETPSSTPIVVTLHHWRVREPDDYGS